MAFGASAEPEGWTNTVTGCLQVVPFFQDSALSAISRYRALVLDSSYRPIDVVSWQRAICLDLFDKAGPLATSLLGVSLLGCRTAEQLVATYHSTFAELAHASNQACAGKPCGTAV